MNNSQKSLIPDIQKGLRRHQLDGWLFYDFRRSNILACRLLQMPPEQLLSRRFFYWVPVQGDPVKVVHRIESHVLDHLPGDKIAYSEWRELEQVLRRVLANVRNVAMEYSPNNAIPTVSKVDAGTAEMVREIGCVLHSSADLLQEYTAVWTDEQLVMHSEAAVVLQNAVENAWKKISSALSIGRSINEYDVQQMLLAEFDRGGCCTEDPPICAVNAHSADPHYQPIVGKSSVIKKGDFILIDVWCKRKAVAAVYADITRVAVAGQPTKQQLEIFDVVKWGRDAALHLVEERVKQGKEVRGCEVDQVCRDAIVKAGYGNYFPHRTGHSIGERDHGDGANIDNYETCDERLLIAGTCFSIEPGVYLPGEFGVRLEDDVYIEKGGSAILITPGLQEFLPSI